MAIFFEIVGITALMCTLARKIANLMNRIKKNGGNEE